MIIVNAECFVGMDTEPVVVNKQLKTQLSAYQLIVVEKEQDVPKEREELDVDNCPKKHLNTI